MNYDPAADHQMAEQYASMPLTHRPPASSPLGQQLRQAYLRHEARQLGRPLPEPMAKSEPAPPPELVSFRPDGQPIGAVLPHAGGNPDAVQAMARTSEPLTKSAEATSRTLEVLAALEKIRSDPAYREQFLKALEADEQTTTPMQKSAAIESAVHRGLEPLRQVVDAATARMKAGIARMGPQGR
jgi:hypothetical protein